MYLSSIRLKNFRCFGENTQEIKFNSGLSLLVGENDSGKSAILDAIRIVLGTTDQSWYRVKLTDFYNEDMEKEISIICRFDELTVSERADFQECLSNDNLSENNAVGSSDASDTDEDNNPPCLYLHWKCSYLKNIKPPRPYVRISTGINGDGQSPDAVAKERIRATYLRALRDANSDMQSGRNSRLSQIFSSINGLNEGISEYTEGVSLQDLSITGIARLSNTLLSEHAKLKKANKDVTDILKNKLLLKNDNITTELQVAGTNVSESKKLIALLEKLDLAINKTDGCNQGNVGLGTSNILSMACELLLNSSNEGNGHSSFLLIEEPEAHIHAQRQLRLIQSLQDEAKANAHQIILTTHSPLLASVVSLDNIIIINNNSVFPMAKGHTRLDDDDYLYLERYLDATKANLFFAKGVVMVEGPSEDLLLPTIAKLIGKSFTDYGISIVNVRSTGLRRFARIFQRADESHLLDVKVACITDRDIMPDCAPSICINEAYTNTSAYPENRKWKVESEIENKEGHINEIKEKADGQSVYTFVSDHWTLEYDLAYSGLREELIEAIVNIKYVEANREANKTEIKTKMDQYNTDEEKSSYLYSFFFGGTSKAEVAQRLALILENKYKDRPDELKAKLPQYIIDAINHVTE